MKLIRKILKKLRALLKGGQSPAQEELRYLQQHGLRIGKHVDIFSQYPFDANYPGLITVGDYVTIAANVKILAHDASMGYTNNGACKIGIVEIGNHVFIGANSTILPNTRIGDYAIIGAGSVVTGDVPAGTVYAGNPARFIKTTEEFRLQHQANMQTHPTTNRPWREFVNLGEAEWAALREQLKDTYGYVIRD